MTHIRKQRAGRPTLAEELFFRTWAKQIDHIPVDTVLRVKKSEAPSEWWLRERCLLNQYTVAIKTSGDDWVIIRLQ